MSKKVLLISVALIIAVCTLALCVGCESYKNDANLSMGDSTAPGSSNGGTVVKQGNYIYFVNGFAGYKTTLGKDNWFGNVLKGAILRIKADATDMSTAEVVVPKSVLSDSKNAGFSIFGDYIYYVSPSAEEDKSGKVQTDTIQFLRTKLNGQDTQLLYQITDKDVTYKYTPNALVVLTDGKLYSKSYDAKSFKKDKPGTLIAEDVTSVEFPVNGDFDVKVGETANDYFFYTKAEEGNEVYSNKVFICNGTGSVNKEIINRNTYTDKPDDIANVDKVFSITLSASHVDASGITLYYSKSFYHGSSATVAGYYGYKFTKTEADNGKIDPAKEHKFALSTPTSVFAMGLEKGYVDYASGIKYVKLNADGEGEVAFEVSGDSVKVTEIYSLDDNGNLLFANDKKLLVSKNINGGDNLNIIVDKELALDNYLICPEILDGQIYFFLSSDNYLYRVNPSEYNRVDGPMTPSLFGKMTQADLDALKEKEEENE